MSSRYIATLSLTSHSTLLILSESTFHVVNFRRRSLEIVH